MDRLATGLWRQHTRDCNRNIAETGLNLLQQCKTNKSARRAFTQLSNEDGIVYSSSWSRKGYQHFSVTQYQTKEHQIIFKDYLYVTRPKENNVGLYTSETGITVSKHAIEQYATRTGYDMLSNIDYQFISMFGNIWQVYGEALGKEVIIPCTNGLFLGVITKRETPRVVESTMVDSYEIDCVDFDVLLKTFISFDEMYDNQREYHNMCMHLINTSHRDLVHSALRLSTMCMSMKESKIVLKFVDDFYQYIALPKKASQQNV